MANASEGDAEQYRALCRPDSPRFILNELEYAAHEDARFHLANGTAIAAASLADADRAPARGTGTDACGTARIGADRAFDYASWMEAVRLAETFVTYGPLVEFAVEGRPGGAASPSRHGARRWR